MIESFHIERFKSYRAADLPVGALTLLVGANASGKSIALEAVRFLQWLASGRRLDDLMAEVQEGDRFVRGSIASLPLPGSETFRLGCRTSGVDWPTFSVTIGVEADGMRIVDERIDGRGTVPLYEVVGTAEGYSHDVPVAYDNFARGGRKPRIVCNDQQAIFTQLGTPARFGAPHRKSQKLVPDTVERYRDLLDQILFLDPSPRRMRGYSFVNQRRLLGDGSNLSSVLYDLCERQGRRDEVLDFVRALPEQEIVDIDFVETQRGEVMVRLEESFALARRDWEAAHLSDGTLRVLSVAAALLSARHGSLVVIEEIDNGVHPGRAESLLGHILDAAEKRHLKVLLTTHNPALLDALPPRAVPDVVCCYRDPEAGTSELVRLEDLADYPRLVAQAPLGRLLTQGVVDRFVKDRRDAEDRLAADVSWLDDFRRQVAEG